MRRLCLSLLLILFCATPAQALRIRQIDCLPPGSPVVLSAVYTPAEIPPVDAVAYEVRHLEAALPVLRSASWPVNIVTRRGTLRKTMLAGCVWPNIPEAFVYATGQMTNFLVINPRPGVLELVPAAPYLTSFAVDHEVGHLVRYQRVSQGDFSRYIGNRNLPATANPEEVFAEDFRYLFGSDLTRQIKYQIDGVSLPEQREREFILKEMR